MRILLALLVFGTTACDETIVGGAPGPMPIPDMGMMGFPELPLQVGDSFVYEAQLTRRRTNPNAPDAETFYRIRLTITDVLDAGEDGVSEVSYEAEQLAELADTDWVPQFDAASWVAQLGPSQTSDAVAGQPTTLLLEGAPSMPTGPKEIPAASTFFVDLRFPTEIQNAWDRPGMTQVDFLGGGARLEFEGDDPTIPFHEDNTFLRLELEYDDRGVLNRMFENIGDSTLRPHSITRLTCTEGCP